MAQILLALDHAHSKGVIHRDIKPSNILCPSAASIKVTDFGVARLDSLDLTNPQGLGAVGTPNYMAPERLLGRAADVRADLFSVGVILYQLLTGSKPFIAFDLPELMRKLLNEAPPSIMTLRPELWTEIDAVAQKALARNPDDRYQSAERFIEGLSAAIEARPHDNRVPVDLTELSRTSSRDNANSEELNASLATKLSSSAADALSRSLAHWLGPIARVIVRQALQETSDIDSLVACLSRHIRADADIAQFRQAAEKLLREDLGMASAFAQETISDAEIKATINTLVPAIGPIARHIVIREARTAVGRDDFYRRLADRIPDEHEKSRFLALRERSAASKTH
jgi:serine/threonine-protein kinase